MGWASRTNPRTERPTRWTPQEVFALKAQVEAVKAHRVLGLLTPNDLRFIASQPIEIQDYIGVTTNIQQTDVQMAQAQAGFAVALQRMKAGSAA